MPKNSSCPNCGAEAPGKFCGECGTPIRRTCSSCEAESPGSARFCQECGASLTGAAPKTGGKTAAPWIAVGAAGLVLAILGAFMILDRQNAPPTAAGSAVSTSPVATDLSTRSPAEAAEGLFNRVMSASEAGDVAEAQRFAPMALDAYRQLAVLDNDAHYHIGLLHLVSNDVDSARAELDAIRRTVPDHLLGIMLEHAIAEAVGDPEAQSAAYARFLEAYDTEIVTDREEYRGHRTGIDGFRARAMAAGR